VPEPSKLARFEESILPHLDAAYNLARWLTRNDQDAEDLVQEAYLRAFRFFNGFRGSNAPGGAGSGRAWLLKIVRNTFYTSLQRRPHEEATLDDELLDVACETCDPETIALASADGQSLRQAVDELPAEFREAMVLRELEGMSYKEIAAITGAPLGTVMSRLARARKHLQARLTGEATARAQKEAQVEL
jgi:RNA polymerase sigma factor (sigma-70 family)